MRRESTDPFVSTEEPVDVDDETAAAIQLGLDDIAAGRTVTLEEARERMQKWFSRLSSQPKL
jgi:predicted transcriptional regulator